MHHGSPEPHRVPRRGQAPAIGFQTMPATAYVSASSSPHKLRNRRTIPLRLLCACAPPISDADTVLTGALALYYTF